MIKLHAAYDVFGRACEHRFHPACLVTSARVAGEGDEEKRIGVAMTKKTAEAGRDEDGEEEEEEDIPISCPVCRAEGSLKRREWEEGVRMASA